MLLQPRKVKHRKMHRGRIHGAASKKTDIHYGDFGLHAQSSAWITARQIEAARRAMTRFVARGGKIWVRIFPDKSVTLKGSEVRMGGGKGPVDHYVAVVKPGMVLFEIAGVKESLAREAMRLASHKLPIRTKFIGRHNV